MKDKKNKKWLTTGKLARIVDVSCRTVCKWCDSGKLPFVKIPGSPDRRIRVEDALKFLLENNLIRTESELLENLYSNSDCILLTNDESLRVSVRDILEGFYEIEYVEDSFTLGHNVSSNTYHVVILDVICCGVNQCMSVLKFIKNKPTRLVLVTDLEMYSTKDLHDMGFANIIHKPLDRESVLNRFKKF